MISISIVSHTHNAMVNQLLKDLAVVEAQTKYEVIVTENIDEDIDIVGDSTGKAIRFIRNTNPQSFARNHNRALLDAEGDYFCILNPDVRWMQPVFSILSGHCDRDEADIVAPLVIDLKGIPQDSFRKLPTPGDLFRRRVLHRGRRPYPFKRGEFVSPDWIAGIFMMMPAVIFHQLGGFDERFRMYFEDVDFCARARLEGHRIGVDTNVVIQHTGSRSSRRSLKYFLWHVLSAFRFYRSPVYRRFRSCANSPER